MPRGRSTKIMARRFSDTVMKLLELGKPYYLNGVWHPPKITRKEMREIRKVMILDGEAWPIKFLKDRGIDKDKPYTREKKRAERYRCISVACSTSTYISKASQD